MPTLSRLERERIAQAIALAASGHKIHWRNIGRRLEYVVDGKAHLVFTNGSDQAHAALCRQVQGEFDAETQRLAQARRTAEEKAKGSKARAVALPSVHGLDQDVSVPDLLSAGNGPGAHGEERICEQRV